MVTFSNCSLLWVSKIQTEIALSTLHFEYVALSYSVGALLPFTSIIKKFIDNLGSDSEKMKFVPSSTVYDNNNWVIVVKTSPRITPKSNQIYFKYHWFEQHVGKLFMIWNIELENQKADIFTKGLQGEFVWIRKLLCVVNPPYEREFINK